MLTDYKNNFLKSIAKKSLLFLLFAHVPHLLVFLGLEFWPLILWIGLIENLPLFFFDLENSYWFELANFGIKSYTWQGFVISIICKYVFILASVLYFISNRLKDDYTVFSLCNPIYHPIKGNCTCAPNVEIAH